MSIPSARWLLLIHAIPPKPDYLRAKVGKRLARLGAVALKNSVYLLPLSADALEDLAWVAREVVDGGGECSVVEANFVGGLSDEELIALFRAARDQDYRDIAEEATRLRLAHAAGETDTDVRPDRFAADVARVGRRLQEVKAIDFFGATGADRAADAVRQLEEALRERTRPHPSARAAEPSIEGSTWVTRRDIHVDRIASGWLIRRFIDARAAILFVVSDAYVPASTHRRFDMFGGEYTHEGSDCTFETLLRRFGLADPALAAIGEIVHDIDLKEQSFARAETTGVARLIDGLVRIYASDDDRLLHGSAVFDALYEAFRATSS
jgi:hypothetical protein